MISCPCCSKLMLIYAQKGRAYWYCSHCRQEMPDLLSVMLTNYQQRRQAAENELSPSHPPSLY